MTFDHYLQKSEEIGVVKSTDFPLVYVMGLPGARIDELVVFESGQFGQVTGLDRDYVEILAYSDKNILPEVRVARTFDRLGLEISTNLLGSVIDAFGHSLYHTSPVKNTGDKYTIEKESVGIANRKKITEPFLTGVSIVDLMVPLGKGQRELVIGDRQTGKTSFVLQTILNQVQTGAVCVYACIGKRKNDIKHVENFFKVHDLMRNSVIITSSANDPLGYIYSTPYSAMTIAEYLKDTGRDVLLILDDMTNHARFYREVSLLLKRFPGRDSYPGDIFYTHSRLLVYQ